MQRSLMMLALCSTLALSLLGTSGAKAQLVYDNGPINGTVDAWTLNSGFIVSDSFTVSSPTTLTGAQFGLWLFPGDTATAIDWSIGTTTYGSDISSGTGASLTNTFQSVNGYGVDLYESTFALDGTLSAGTYWFTLQNLVVPNNDPGYWDENDGPSAAFENPYGSIATYDQNNGYGNLTGSESFQLYGTTTAVPEPGSIALLGSLALTSAGFLARRRK